MRNSLNKWRSRETHSSQAKIERENILWDGVSTTTMILKRSLTMLCVPGRFCPCQSKEAPALDGAGSTLLPEPRCGMGKGSYTDGKSAVLMTISVKICRSDYGRLPRELVGAPWVLVIND